MIFIDPARVELLIPTVLKTKLDQLTSELISKPTPEERKAFIKKYEDAWKEVREYLAEAVSKGGSKTDFKCWYCEEKSSRFTYHVDHFRPKGKVRNPGCTPEEGYWWLAFRWQNYRLSCEYCNSPHTDEEEQIAKGKWDQFPLSSKGSRASAPNADLRQEIPLLIDPTDPIEVKYLAFNDDGTVAPRPGLPGFATQKAEKTIEVLNLKEPRLVEGRKALAQKLEALIAKGDAHAKILEDPGSPFDIAASESALLEILQQLKETIQPWSEFSSMARYYLIGKGRYWIYTIFEA
ncbi:MAG: TIGR02646 family protein [Anaerolineales bacterium]|jgi:uncharacterized protein (TIGR02646 family)|nr:TIGR02646 family protein [Anaerolineales bacterium]